MLKTTKYCIDYRSFTRWSRCMVAREGVLVMEMFDTWTLSSLIFLACLKQNWQGLLQDRVQEQRAERKEWEFFLITLIK